VRAPGHPPRRDHRHPAVRSSPKVTQVINVEELGKGLSALPKVIENHP